ncbi:MAG: repair protein RecO [Candidatus Hydrogenedentota bacterium]
MPVDPTARLAGCTVTQEKTEAVVLRGVDFSESSRVVTFLTPSRGLLACMAKGVRRKGSALACCLVNLNRVEVVFQHKPGREVQTLFEATLLDGYRGLRVDADKGFYAAFPAELAGRAAQAEEPSEALYGVLVRGLKDFEAWDGDRRTHAVWQALRLLDAAGFAPVLEHCLDSGAAPGASPGFCYEGGVVSSAARADLRLTPRQYEELKMLAGARRECPLRESDPGLFRLAWHYARRQLDADFRSARVLQEMYG